MSSEKLYSEIFEEFQKAETKQDRINILRKYDHSRFREFLIAAFHPNIHFDIDPPPYRPAPEPAGLNFSYLDSEMSRLYRFIKNHPHKPQGLFPDKQRQLLLVILESLHKDEAELLVKTFNKKLDIKFLTPNLINEAFPNLIPV
jgi:hypothetical protein